jgi:imidazolonepropionase-like amidohydrolase
MVRRAPLALVIEWPSMQAAASGDEEGASKRPPFEERIARLDEMIDEARAYDAALLNGSERAADVRWDSLRPVVRGEMPVWIRATSLMEIHAALDWTDRHGLEMVLVDGAGSRAGDSWRCADELAARGIPVVLRTNRLPARRYEPYDTPFVAPARLVEAGVAVAFGSWSSASARNLPHEVARAVAFGLPRAAAERAITLGGAEILGVADRYGSLEAGKSATFILVEGDLLETRMQVRRAWLDGRELNLDDRHKELYRHWSARPMPASARSEPK